MFVNNNNKNKLPELLEISSERLWLGLFESADPPPVDELAMMKLFTIVKGLMELAYLEGKNSNNV